MELGQIRVCAHLQITQELQPRSFCNFIYIINLIQDQLGIKILKTAYKTFKYEA